MTTTWVVVAESSRARIFQIRDRGREFRELADLVHTESRLKGIDLKSDSPGRALDSQGLGRHGMGRETDARRHEAMVFAGEIADKLEAGRTGGKYDRLILAAPPEFLGQVRASISPETAVLVDKTLNKNVARLKPDEIRAHLDL